MAIIKDKGIVKLKKGERFDPNLLPVIQNLLGLGYSEADIGIIVGYAGREPKSFIKKLKQRNEEVKEICNTGKQLADIFLVSQAFKAATWQKEMETETIYAESDKLGNKLEKRVPIRTKEKRKIIKPDGTLLAKLLESRMPEYFSSVKKTEKRSISLDVEGEFQDLLDGLKRKETNVIDAVFEEPAMQESRSRQERQQEEGEQK